MSTKVFISWSGDLSNKLAEELRQWLPGVLQFVKPYFTPSDIEKGTKWVSEILGELEGSDIGIICLTKENLDKPWILFESGALSKNIDKSRVCTLLFGVETTDLKGPLTIFQKTKFENKDFRKLVKTINNSGGDSKLEESILDEVFAMWWPKLETKVSKIMLEHRSDDESEHRTERDILEEVLELTRLSVSRQRRGTEISRAVLHDLVRYLSELTLAVESGDMEVIMMMEKRLDKPIRYICEHSHFPELYEEYRMMRHRMRHIEDNNKEGEDKV